MTKTNQATFQPTLDYGGSSERKAGFLFNRFSIKMEGEFVILYLGAVISDDTVDCNVFAISKFELQQVYNNIEASNYLGKLGDISRAKPKEWDFPRNYRINVVNVINIANTDKLGELTFFNIVIHEAVVKMQSDEKKLAAMLCGSAYCDISLHKQVMGHLFHEKLIPTISH